MIIVAWIIRNIGFITRQLWLVVQEGIEHDFEEAVASCVHAPRHPRGAQKQEGPHAADLLICGALPFSPRALP